MQLRVREKDFLRVLLLAVCGLVLWTLTLDSLWSHYLQAAETVRITGKRLERAWTAVARRSKPAQEHWEPQAVLARVVLYQPNDSGLWAMGHVHDLVRELRLTEDDRNSSADRRMTRRDGNTETTR